MKTQLFRAICSLLVACPGLAWSQAPKVFRVKAGEYPDKVIPYADRYQFSQFKPGKAEFSNGRVAQANFNYNYVGGHIFFVDYKRDTLEIIDKELLKNLSIGDKSYRFDKRWGYCEVVQTFSRASLGKREVLARIGTEKGGPYGISYTASSVTTYRSYSSDQAATSKKLNADAEILLTYRSLYYLIDNNNRFYITTPANVRKLYPAHKKEIDQYLKTHPVDFAKEQDVLRLLAHCDAISG